LIGRGGILVAGLQDDSSTADYPAASTVTAEANGKQASKPESHGHASDLHEHMHQLVNGQQHVTAPPLPWCKETYVRIMVQAMRDLGYTNSATSLELEAGVRLKSDIVTQLEAAVVAGRWQEVDLMASSDLLGFEPCQRRKCRFLIKRQEYLELLEVQDVTGAISCLQTHMTGLAPDAAAVHRLAQLLICSDVHELYAHPQWPGEGKLSRQSVLEQVHACLPAPSVVPAGRLKTLVSQSLEHQMLSCTRYNRAHPWTDLLQDCTAGEEELPRTTRYVLEQHEDEVWHLEFSHSGRYLASASKDKTVIIWSMQSKPTVTHHLKAHTDCVSYVAWSKDDKWLLSAGNDLVVKLWDTASGALLRDFTRHSEPVTAMAWLDEEGRFVTGSYDKQLITWHMDSNEPLSVLEGERVTDLAVSKDASRLVIITPDKKVKAFALPSMLLLPTSISQALADNESITSLSLSHDSRYLLLNISSQSRPEVQLWDIEHKVRVQKFKGHKHARYVIRSSLGGNREAFVVSGSEDSQVFLWHRETGSLIRALCGHSGTINSVSWNPTNPSMFASASDDTTIRIWGP